MTGRALPTVEPRTPRRMLKPRKSVLYATVDQQAAEIERLRIDRDRLAAENERLCAPAWRRLFTRSPK